MYFRDHLRCGHTVLVEVLVPIDPVLGCTRDVGSFSFCGECPPRQPRGVALSEIVSTDHVLAPGVWADANDCLHLDLTVMIEAAGFEPTEANKATLIEAARQAFPATEVEVLS
jgi:hypothetical protein